MCLARDPKDRIPTNEVVSILFLWCVISNHRLIMYVPTLRQCGSWNMSAHGDSLMIASLKVTTFFTYQTWQNSFPRPSIQAPLSSFDFKSVYSLTNLQHDQKIRPTLHPVCASPTSAADVPKRQGGLKSILGLGLHNINWRPNIPNSIARLRRQGPGFSDFDIHSQQHPLN